MDSGSNMGKKAKPILKWIAIVVILTLAIWFIWANLYVKSTGTPLGSRCLANNDFSCYYLAYHHSTGNLSMELSQNTNYTFYNVQIAFVPKYSFYSKNIYEFPWNTSNAVILNGDMTSGKLCL